ncbi:MAG: hypothetical protein R3E48_03480 [Burkholderiaceae bacterium]
MIRHAIIAATLVFAAGAAHADQAVCKAASAEMKLQGAAKTKFRDRCMKNEINRCTKLAKMQKTLSKKEKHRFMVECVKRKG